MFKALQALGAVWGGGRRKNLWFKLGEKAPQAYIVARRVE